MRYVERCLKMVYIQFLYTFCPVCLWLQSFLFYFIINGLMAFSTTRQIAVLLQSCKCFLFCENVGLCDDTVWDKGDVDAATTPLLLPPLTPTSECVNNKIIFSVDEWRENAIKENRRPFGVIYNRFLFII